MPRRNVGTARVGVPVRWHGLCNPQASTSLREVTTDFELGLFVGGFRCPYVVQIRTLFVGPKVFENFRVSAENTVPLIHQRVENRLHTPWLVRTVQT